MATAKRLSGLVIQAFKSLGQDHIAPQHMARLRARIPADERARLLPDLHLAPAWMRPLLRELARVEETDEGEGALQKRWPVKALA